MCSTNESFGGPPPPPRRPHYYLFQPPVSAINFSSFPLLSPRTIWMTPAFQFSWGCAKHPTRRSSSFLFFFCIRLSTHRNSVCDFSLSNAVLLVVHISYLPPFLTRCWSRLQLPTLLFPPPAAPPLPPLAHSLFFPLFHLPFQPPFSIPSFILFLLLLHHFFVFSQLLLFPPK